MNLNKLFKATPKLDETDNVVNRGASLDPGQTVVKAR